MISDQIMMIMMSAGWVSSAIARHMACNAGAVATERDASEVACPTVNRPGSIAADSDAALPLAGEEAALHASLLAALKAARERARAADEALSHLILPRAMRAACAPLERAAAAFAPRLAACSLGGATWLVCAVCALAALAFFAAGARTRADEQAIVLGLTIISAVFGLRCAMSARGVAPSLLPRTGVAPEYADAALADELRGAEALAAAAEARLAAATAADDAGATRDSEYRAALSRIAYRVLGGTAGYAYGVIAEAAGYVRGPDVCARVGACLRSWRSVAHATVALLFLAGVAPFIAFDEIVFMLAVPVAARASFAACCCNATLSFGVDVLLLLATTALYYIIAGFAPFRGRMGAY
jgi:hypothetical protein